MNLKSASIILISAAVFIGTQTMWAAISLKTAPEKDSPVVATVAEDSASLKNAQSVPDKTLAANGWHTVNFKSNRTGHVPSENVSKNFAIKNRTPIFSAQNKKSQIITYTEPGDTYEAIGSNDDWITVRFSKSTPVYFQKVAVETPRQNTLALPNWESAINIREEEQSNSDLKRGYHFNPNLKVGETKSAELAPENVTWEGTQIERPPQNTHLIPRSPLVDNFPPSQQTPPPTLEMDLIPIIVEKRIPQPSELPQKPQLAPGTPTRTFAGVLERKIKNSGPRYPLQLKSRSGGRIAFVDMSKLFISDLRPYLDRNVSITGEVVPIVPGSNELVIYARTIRLPE